LVQDQDKLKVELLKKNCKVKTNNNILYGQFADVNDNVINLIESESEKLVKIPVDSIEKITISNKIGGTLVGAALGVSIAWLAGLERLDKGSSEFGPTDPKIHSSVTSSALVTGAAIGGVAGFFMSDKDYKFEKYLILDNEMTNETKKVYTIIIENKYIDLDKDFIQKIKLNSKEYYIVKKEYFESELLKYKTCEVDSVKNLSNGFIVFINNKQIKASNSDINQVIKSDGKTFIISKTKYCEKLKYLK
jgi:hypothetical protein